MRRLARQHIGPRLLGTFKNGRFEEYLHAHPLKPQDLRDPVTSMQIAKRMRELHDGIKLLKEERDSGSFVWRNWDKWVDRCEEVVSFVDRQVLSNEAKTRAQARFKARGLVCGTEWALFKKTVEKYRKWLEEQYGNPRRLRDRLVFSHNDVSLIRVLTYPHRMSLSADGWTLIDSVRQHITT